MLHHRAPFLLATVSSSALAITGPRALVCICTMAQLDKRYEGAPFGTQTPRFDVAGVHPANKTPASFTQVNYCHKSMEEKNRSRGPGIYDIEKGGFNPIAVSERAAGPGWARAYEVKTWSSMPHLLNKEQWEARQSLSKKIGPGSYEIKDFAEINDLVPRSKIGICGYLGKRMGEPFKEKTPGPGTYGEGGIPHSEIEKKEKRSTSTIGMLDQATSGKRELPKVGCHIGPGNYNFKSTVDEFLNKQVSTRGPYELFSLDRNKPISTGHYARIAGAVLSPGQYNLNSFTDDLEKYDKKSKGKFGKTEQHPQKSDRIFYSTLSQVPKPDAADRPGPTTYNPDVVFSKPENHGDAGFLSKSVRADKRAMRFFTGNYNSVGPGRYEVQVFKERQHRNGHESVFKSKTGRIEAAEEKAFRERIREKDVLKENRIHLVRPDNLGLIDNYTQKKSFTVM